ncbi:unnamed protein product, partial [Symbiodinium pilosum]
MEWFMDGLQGKRVVLSGCGGGCDVLGTSVIYQQVRGIAEKVIFFSLSFTKDELLTATAEQVSSKCWRVDPGNVVIAEDPRQQIYFPEARMANVTNIPVYTLSHFATIAQYTEGYEAALRREFGDRKPSADVLILCDGGCDVLLTGAETSLATPVEDMSHLKAVLPLDIPEKYVSALGVNIDCGHGVIQEELDRRLVDMQCSGTMLCSYPMTLQDAPAVYFAELVNRCAPAHSIVQSLVVAAMQGHRGLFTPPHLKRRITKNKVPLSEQTATFFLFLLEALASEILYLDQLQPEHTVERVAETIREF